MYEILLKKEVRYILTITPTNIQIRVPLKFDFGHQWAYKSYHDDIIKWKHFPRYWPFVRGIHRKPVMWDAISLITTQLQWWRLKCRHADFPDVNYFENMFAVEMKSYTVREDFSRDVNVFRELSDWDRYEIIDMLQALFSD